MEMRRHPIPRKEKLKDIVKTPIKIQLKVLICESTISSTMFTKQDRINLQKTNKR